MNTALATVATALSLVAVYLPTRTQAFTHVSVGGRDIRMLIAGRGDATVVFENGLGASLEMWGKVQPAVSRFARTVSYDRLSPWRDDRLVAAELRQALQNVAVTAPIILVGASRGGPYIRVFADMYPRDVAAMVLVDPTVDSDHSRARRVPAGTPVFLIDAISPDEVPFATESIRVLRMHNRVENAEEAREYRRWLEGTPGSRLIVTRRSGHNVPIEQPDLVIETIRQAVAAARR